MLHDNTGFNIGKKSYVVTIYKHYSNIVGHL